MNEMKKIIEIRDLHKKFGKVHAVNGLSFDVCEGELFAFLGVNGAGKSTTINILCSQLSRDEGSVKINGYDTETDAEKMKGEIGVVFQGSVLDRSLTVRENLESRASLYGIYKNAFDKRLSELCELLELDALLDRTLGKLSGGQRRRIDIARALLPRPKLLILDEPTTGLDPQTRKTLWSVIDGLRRREQLTVLLTTHYMEEAADADRVLIIDGGRRIAEGTPLELKNTYTNDYITLYGADEERVRSLGVPCESLRGACRLSIPDTRAATELILAHPDLFVDYEITKGKMDDVFLAVTGKSLGAELDAKNGKGA